MRSLPPLLCAFSLLAAAAAHGQASAVRDRYQTDGVGLPPTGVALLDEGTAPELNPAGVALLAKPQLFYLHERNLRQDRLVDSAFLGTGLFGWGGASLGLQWVRPGAGAPDYRKTTWTLALGGERLALGASYNLFSSRDDALEELSSWDAGLTVRPWRYLSIGAAARDFNGPFVGDVQLPRRFDLGLAFRPFTDRVALAADFLIDDQRGMRGSRLSFAAQAEVLEGLVLSGGLATGLREGGVVGQVALTLNTPYLGATWAGGGGSGLGSSWDQVVQLRLSADRYRALPLARDRVLVLDVPQRLTRASGGLIGSLLMPSTREPYLELLGTLERVRRDPKTRGVLVKVSQLPEIGHARVEELRQALLAVRASGKHVWAIFMDGGDDEYLLATAAEKIWAVPQATFLVNGYTASATYLAGTLSKIGVSVDVARVGEFKTAPDAFTRTDMSAEERQMLDAWLDGLFERHLAVVSQARGLAPERLREIIGQGILSARAAREAGLVDEIVYPDELQGLVEKGQGRALDLVGEEYQAEDWPRRWGGRPRIAVINVEGLIAEGRSRADPLGLTRVAGAQTVLRALERAVSDPRTKAIVVRVDSSGGSGAASDLIWRAIKKVREYKPVVVSMGDVAASGGYYIAMAGERVFAEPSTLTGSIGVFALKPNLAGLLDGLGIGQETLRRGERADLFSLTRAWTEGEQAAMQRYVDEFYDDFITKAAESRRLDKAQVDAVGRGRVFSGQDAVRYGLVDELGGLRDAVEWAKERTGLAGAEVELEVVREGVGLLEIDPGAAAQERSAEERARFARALGEAAEAVGIALELPNGPLAMLPYRVRAK